MVKISEHPRIDSKDLEVAKSWLENLKSLEQSEAHRVLAIAIAEQMYEPTEKLLRQPLSDFYYYVLRLSQMLDLGNSLNPDEEYKELNLNQAHSVLMHQAKFLIFHGSLEVLTKERRHFLYGQDEYIAKNIALYLSGGNEFVGLWQQSNLNNLLEKISDSAHLDGIEAIGRWVENPCLPGYELPGNFDVDDWRQNWEDTSKYPPVPFSIARTIAFVKERFNIMLSYPF